MTALLVDGNNVVVRAVRAIDRPGQTGMSVDGVATGALLITINTLSKHVREESPDRVMIAFDGGASTHRRALDAAYKADRAEVKSESETSAFALVRSFLEVAGVPYISRPGVEADDILAHYSRTTRPAVLISSDKDLLQTLAPGVEQVRLSSAGTPTDRWTARRVEEVFGCTPARLPTAMALAGDVSDGVPGVPGFGMKTAVKVLKGYDWGFHQAITDHPRLVDHRARAELNLRLVDLRIDIPELELPPIPDFLPTGPGSVLFEDLLQFLHRYRLASVTSRIYAGSLWQTVAPDPVEG